MFIISTFVAYVVLISSLKTHNDAVGCSFFYFIPLSGLSQWNKVVESSERKAEFSPVLIPKDINIINFSDEIQALPAHGRSLEHLNPLRLSEFASRNKRPCEWLRVGMGRMDYHLALRFFFELWEREVFWEGMFQKKNIPGLTASIRWGMSMIEYNKLNSRMFIQPYSQQTEWISGNICPKLSFSGMFCQFYGVTSRFSGIAGRISGFFSVVKTGAHQAELPPKQKNLSGGGYSESGGEKGQYASIQREPPIKSGFFVGLVLFLCCFLCAPFAGEYFYRDRKLIGSSFVCIGIFCAFAAWSIGCISQFTRTWCWPI